MRPRASPSESVPVSRVQSSQTAMTTFRSSPVSEAGATAPVLADHFERQIETAYRRMAEAHYRPAAPSDGMGNLAGELDLDAEIRAYTERFYREEDSRVFNIGCANGADRS